MLPLVIEPLVVIEPKCKTATPSVIVAAVMLAALETEPPFVMDPLVDREPDFRIAVPSEIVAP